MFLRWFQLVLGMVASGLESTNNFAKEDITTQPHPTHEMQANMNQQPQHPTMEADSQQHEPACQDSSEDDTSCQQHCHKAVPCEFACAHRASLATAPVIAVGTPVLLAGCAVGIPVAAGVPAVALPEGKALFHVAMSFVEADDLHGVFEMARRGVQAVDFKRKCGFAVALRPEVGAFGESLPRQLRVRGASLLHYAICIGSFRAAAALLVACPEMLQGMCSVTVTDGGGETPSLLEELWGAAELARIFCVLYAEEGDAEVSATSAMYNQALEVLELGEKDAAALPFLGLPTSAQRVAAAGSDSDVVLAAMFAAVDIANGVTSGDTAMAE